MLHRLIKKEDYEKAVLLSKEMGNYFRFITRSGRDIVNLEEENGHARIYAQLQGMRFEGRIKVFYEELPEKYKKSSGSKIDYSAHPGECVWSWTGE